MGLPVTVYRSTDAGAPQLVTGKPSSWINILKKVLVDGYGDKSPLGWTVQFEDTGTRSIVFRNSLTNGGSGCYVKFYSVGGSDNNYTTLGIKVAQSFTDINTFIKGVGARGLSNASGYNDWEIIGTSRGFYVMLLNPTHQMGVIATPVATQFYFIGDIHSYTPNDSCPFTIVSGTSGTGDNTSSNGITYWQTLNLFASFYSTDGSTGYTEYSFTRSTTYQNLDTLTGNAELLGINHQMIPVFILGVSSQNTSVTMPYFRGVIPGLYISSFAGYRTDSWPYDIDQSGVKWILIKSPRSPQHWVKTGTWYD